MTQTGPVTRRIPLNQEDATVRPLELFFDLVFVFALTQVTALMADDLTPTGMLRGLLVLGLLWWSWIGYAWLCNVVDPESGAVRVVLLLAMAAMFVLALAIPEAFDDLDGTGLQGPVVVAVCYFLFRLLHLVMFWLVSHDDPGLRRQVVKFAPSMVGGTLVLLVASQTEGTTQTLLWATALAADYLGTLLAGAEGWRIRSCGHFAERHGLILIVALGESIVAIGVGVALLPITMPIVVASIVGLGVASALWWAYFDMTALSAEHAFAAEPLETRARFARDAYTFWHLPLIVGVVLTALGMKKVLEYVGDGSHHEPSDALPLAAVVALCGGVAVYLVGHVGFKLRTGHEVMPSRLAATVAVLALVAVGTSVPALLLLALVALVLGVMVGFERVHYAQRRRELHGH